MTATGRILYLPWIKDTGLDPEALEISLGPIGSLGGSVPYPRPQVWEANTHAQALLSLSSLKGSNEIPRVLIDWHRSSLEMRPEILAP